VIVDMRDLAFADLSLMVDLLALARRQRVRGRAVRFWHPQPQVKALIEGVGLHRLPGVTVDVRRIATDGLAAEFVY
jgi:anti-anti-sigma regulatory factor